MERGPFYSTEKRLQYVEQRMRQHHVDVQRLWKRAPAGPDHYGDPQTSTAVAIVFDEPATGAPSGGTVRCSQGFYQYQQCRWAGRGRSLATDGNAAWSSPAAAQGPPDGVGAVCNFSEGARSHWLTLDQFGFVIPADAIIDNVVAHATLKLVGLGGTTPGYIVNAWSNQFGSAVPDNHPNDPKFKWSNWFHRNGSRFAGRPASWGGGTYSTSGAENFAERSYWSFHDPSPIDSDRMVLTTALTPAEINATTFGVIAQLKWPDAGSLPGTAPTTIVCHIDAIRICVSYSVFHSTGCSGV